MPVKLDTRAVIAQRISHTEISGDYSSLVEFYGEPCELIQFGPKLLDAVLSGCASVQKNTILKILEQAFAASDKKRGFVYTYIDDFGEELEALGSECKLVKNIGEKYFDIIK